MVNFADPNPGALGSNAPDLENRVIVREASDFGVIDSSKQYFLDGIIDFTGTGLSLEIPAGGIYIGGYNFDISGLKCTDDSFTLFTSPVGGSGNILFDELFIEVSGALSKVYDIVSNTGFEAIETGKVNYNNCTSLGAVDNYRQGLESGTGRFGGKPELTLKGTWLGGYFIDTSIIRSLDDGAYSLYKAGAGFSMASRFRSNQNIDLPALTSFVDFSQANFVNPSTLQLENCIITRNGVIDSSDSNLTPNMSESDLASSWSGNEGLPNTFVGGSMEVSTEATTAIVSDGVFVDLAGTFTASDLQHFDSPLNGQIRHLGNSPVEFSISSQFVLESTSNDVVSIKVVIFRAATTSFVDGNSATRVINNLQGTRNVSYFSLFDNVTLNQNDYVKIQVANIGDTADVTAELGSYFKVSTR